MRLRSMIVALCATTYFAVPAYGAPDETAGDDGGFLSALHQVDIHFADPSRALGAGKAVCGMLDNGESGLELVHDLKARNPGFNMEDASDFAMISAQYYCPQHLSKA